MEAAFICSEELWSRGFGEGHPLTPERLKRTYELLTAYHAFDTPASRLVEPRPATREQLLLFHTAEYVDAVERLSAPQGEGEEGALAWRYGLHPGDTPAFAGMFEVEGLKVGAGRVQDGASLRQGDSSTIYPPPSKPEEGNQDANVQFAESASLFITGTCIQRRHTHARSTLFISSCCLGRRIHHCGKYVVGRHRLPQMDR